ncbi:tetratricopeptide repeat protein [Streptosporangium vulgare]|uniref:Tetratricopeptide repeat protein n=2 Tax=Streptosporangium vulgare TaxID=46190 RepID=A0ABV5TRE4_9ACTN
MTGPDDWAPFVAAITEHQQRSERGGAFLRAAAEVEQGFADRAAFHRALHADDVTAEELAALCGATAGETARLRADLEPGTIRFTPAEPASCVIHLSRSFTRVSKLMGLDGTHEFLFATDYRYRPHASVQQWADSRYLVLMGRYVVQDMWALSLVLAQLVVVAGRAFPGLEEPWTHPAFPRVLLDTAHTNPYLHQQIAYGMCAMVEGERFRTAIGVDDDETLAPVMFEIARGAMDFLVGHELSHVYRGHLHAAGRPADEFPWFAGEAFDRVRESPGGAAAVETYLRDYWPAHSLELEADRFAMMSAADTGASVARDLRLVGIEFAVSVLSFLDRASYLTEYGDDPAEAVGLREYSRVPGLVDVLLPMETHPWGKTRATAVTSEVQLVYRSLVEPAELRRKALLMQAVGNVLSSMSGRALNAIQWINSRPGESLAVILPDDKLLTHYWPPEATTDDARLERLESSASLFYSDLTGADPPADAQTVATACRVAFARMREEQGILPEAILRIMSWYAPGGIPLDLFRQGDMFPTDELDAALATLEEHSLIALDGSAVRVDPLVQAVGRDADEVEEEEVFPAGETLDVAVVLLSSAVPEWHDPAGQPVWRELLPHIDAVAGHLADVEREPPLVLWNDTAQYLLDQGMVERGLGYALRALSDGQRLNGPDHPDTLALRHSLGLAYTAAGDHAKAISVLERIIADQERLLGARHPVTLTSRNSLASAHLAAGDFARAIALLERTVTDRRRALGRDHPHTLASQNDLAMAYSGAGELSRAIQLLRRVVARSERVSGADHPDVVIARGNLAYAYYAAGRVAEAIPLLERSVADHERVFGPDHPDTLTTRTVLTDAVEGAARPGGAPAGDP